MQIVDLSQPYGGYGKYGQTFQALAGLMQIITQGKQLARQEMVRSKLMELLSGEDDEKTLTGFMAKPLDVTPKKGLGGVLDIFNPFTPAARGTGPIEEMVMSGMMKNLFTDPLEKQYLQSRITATEALTKQREEELKFAEPDRMLRRASLQLRIADGAMREYYWAEEGPYRDRLLKQAISARENAIEIADKYGTTSEAGNLFEDELKNIDEQIERAGGKVSPVKSGNAGIKKFVVDKYPRPKTKVHFNNTLNHISSPTEKERYFEKWWRPEFGARK